MSADTCTTVIIRAATSDDALAIAGVHVASWKETYRGLIPDDVIDSRTLERRVCAWTTALVDPDRLTFVATLDGVVTAFASALVQGASQAKNQGYLQTLYVLREAQGRRIGRKLLEATARALKLHGCSGLTLDVLVNNHSARDFYEHLGARYVREKIQLHEGDTWLDAVYEWKDLGLLAAQ